MYDNRRLVIEEPIKKVTYDTSQGYDKKKRKKDKEVTMKSSQKQNYLNQTVNKHKLIFPCLGIKTQSKGVKVLKSTPKRVVQKTQRHTQK
mmetsp:Transcript_3462/g.6899  ORF Transcript_3462/g.6899 Transcript_3462/m.6899 type:complete len:90 (+) Transcript_3462:201-470(+)